MDLLHWLRSLKIDRGLKWAVPGISEILYCILSRGSAAGNIQEEEAARLEAQERQVVVELDGPVALGEEPEHQHRFAMVS